MNQLICRTKCKIKLYKKRKEVDKVLMKTYVANKKTLVCKFMLLVKFLKVTNQFLTNISFYKVTLKFQFEIQIENINLGVYKSH